MGYMHIENLYKNQTILQLDEVYALEKIHGTSAHIKFREGRLSFYSGGASQESFVPIFDAPFLQKALESLGLKEVVVYGEAYGGKLQGMRQVYGDDLRFVVFDVKFDDKWLTVPLAKTFTEFLKLEFVHFVKISTKLEELNRERDADSVQALRNGMGSGHKREGIVLRPLEELIDHRDNRIIAKHKIAQFGETNMPREIDPNRRIILEKADEIAKEWVTQMRLEHVLDQANSILMATPQLSEDKKTLGSSDTKTIIEMMVEDIKREAKGEIIESEAAIKAIKSRTAKLFLTNLNNMIKETK